MNDHQRAWIEQRHPLSNKLMLWCHRCQAWTTPEQVVQRFRALEASDEERYAVTTPLRRAGEC